MNKLSIITINLNNKAGLQKTITSVLNQNCKNFEYIIIDGDSKDGSKEFIESFNEKVSCWVSEPDRGIYQAMNKGIHLSNGEYLLFLNSGDYLYNNDTVKKILVELGNDDIVYGDWILYYNNGKTIEEKFPSLITFDFLAFKYSMPHQASFIKRRLLLDLKLYDENLNIVSDWKFFLLALFKHNCSTKHVDQFISFYNKDGFSSADWDKKDSVQKSERREVLDKEFPGLLTYIEAKDKRIKYFENSLPVKVLRKLGIHL